MYIYRYMNTHTTTHRSRASSASPKDTVTQYGSFEFLCPSLLNSTEVSHTVPTTPRKKKDKGGGNTVTQCGVLEK